MYQRVGSLQLQTDAKLGNTMLSQGMPQIAGGILKLQKLTSLALPLVHWETPVLATVFWLEEVCRNNPSNVNLQGFTIFSIIIGNESLDK